jgi:hypothetical protein
MSVRDGDASMRDQSLTLAALAALAVQTLRNATTEPPTERGASIAPRETRSKYPLAGELGGFL